MQGVNTVQHEEFSRSLFNETNDAIFVVDPADLRIVDANPMAQRLTGRRRKALLQLSIPEIILAEDEQWKDRLFDAARQTNIFHSREGYLLLRENDVPLPVNVSVSRLHADPAPQGLIVVRDVSERKAAEAALRRSEAHFKALVENTDDWILLFDKDARLVFCNSSFQASYQAMHGALPSIGERLSDQLFGESGFWSAHIGRAMAGERFTIENRFGQADRVRCFESSFNPIVEDRKTTGVSIFAKEVTQRWRAEQSLEEIKERLSLTASCANIGLWDYDLRAGEFHFASSWKQQLGYSDDEIGSGFDELDRRVHPEDREKVRSAVAQFVQDPEANHQVEFRIQHRDGSYRWFLSRASAAHDADGRPVRMVGSHIEITQLAITRHLLHDSESRCRTLIAAAPEATAIVEVESGLLVECNPRAESMFKLPAGKLLLKRFVDFCPPKQPDGRLSQDVLQEHIRTAIAGSTPKFAWNAQDANGTIFACEVSLVRLPSLGNTLIRLSIADLRERDQIADERDRFAALVESSPDPILATDLEANGAYINSAGLGFLGLADEAAFRTKSLEECVAESDRRRLRSVILPDVRHNGQWRGSLVFRHFTDSRTQPADCTIYLLRDTKTGKPQYVLAISRPRRHPEPPEKV